MCVKQLREPDIFLSMVLFQKPAILFEPRVSPSMDKSNCKEKLSNRFNFVVIDSLLRSLYSYSLLNKVRVALLL